MGWRRPSLEQTALRAGALLILAVTVAALGYLLVELAVVSLAAFGALLLTALLWPLARRLERWRVPPSLASFATLLAALAVLGVVAAWVIPRAAREISTNRDRLTENVSALGTRLGADDWTGGLREKVTAYVRDNGERIASGVAGGLVTAAEVLSALLLGLVLTFFFVRDGERLARWALGHLAADKRAVFRPALQKAWETLRGWIRAAALIALVDAIGIGVGLAILGVPLAFPLAVLTFLGGFIPVVGATVAGAVAVLVAWATGGTTDALWTVGIVLAVQQLEGNVLEPLVMGRALPLHPAAVLVVVTAGALLAGIPGAFASVPLVAMGVAFATEVHARSESALPPAPPEPDEPPADEHLPLQH